MFSSNAAGEISRAFSIITVMCVILLVMVTAAMLVFVFKYSRKRHPRASETKYNIPLEITWTIVPTVLVLIMFYFGRVNLGHIRAAPKNAMPVHVIGLQRQEHLRPKGKNSFSPRDVPDVTLATARGKWDRHTWVFTAVR